MANKRKITDIDVMYARVGKALVELNDLMVKNGHKPEVRAGPGVKLLALENSPGPDTVSCPDLSALIPCTVPP